MSLIKITLQPARSNRARSTARYQCGLMASERMDPDSPAAADLEQHWLAEVLT